MSPFETWPGVDGTPLVLLHGFLGRSSVWVDALSGLARRPHVAAGCLPGHGPQAWRPGEEDFEAAVEAIAAAIPFEEPVCIVGYSMGARLGLSLTLRYPDRVAGALLVGCHPGLRSEQERKDRAAADASAAARILELGLAEFVSQWEQQPLFATQAALPAEVRRWHRQRRLDHTAEGAAWAMRVLSLGRMPPLWDELRRSSVPLCFVTGGLDGKYRALAEEIVAIAPAATHRSIPGAGHDVVLERPVAFASELQSFLSKCLTHLQERT